MTSKILGRMFSGNIGVYGVMGNLWREQGIVTINGGDEKKKQCNERNFKQTMPGVE